MLERVEINGKSFLLDEAAAEKAGFLVPIVRHRIGNV